MELVNYKWLEGLFGEAEKEAKKSPCVRRQYGALIYNEWVKVGAHNERVSGICDQFCIRERAGIANGTHIQTEMGAEIHAEAAALIRWKDEFVGDHFILVGFMHGQELLDRSAYPCLACAKMIKFAGYKHIFLRGKDREIQPYSIASIIEELESEYDDA